MDIRETKQEARKALQDGVRQGPLAQAAAAVEVVMNGDGYEDHVVERAVEAIEGVDGGMGAHARRVADL